MSLPSVALGILVCDLIERLKGEVESPYVTAGLNWHPRYACAALVDALRAGLHQTLVLQTGISHSAVSQSVFQMCGDHLVTLKPGAHARERIVALTEKATHMIPALQRQWAATAAAAAALDAELSTSLSALLEKPSGCTFYASSKTVVRCSTARLSVGRLAGEQQATALHVRIGVREGRASGCVSAGIDGAASGPYRIDVDDLVRGPVHGAADRARVPDA